MDFTCHVCEGYGVSADACGECLTLGVDDEGEVCDSCHGMGCLPCAQCGGTGACDETDVS